MASSDTRADIEEILDKYRPKGVKIDLGCGRKKQPGFLGVDLVPHDGVDIIQDLEEFPWVLPDECSELVIASHLVEHINPHRGVFVRFMDEVWRILEPGGKFMIATPYAGSRLFYQDPTHVNPCNEITWAYFDPLEPRSQGLLFKEYMAKPWKILNNTYIESGILEVALEKRLIDRSYYEYDTD